MPRGGKREGAGRKAGSPNVLTTEMKQLVLQALNEAGGVAYLVAQAHDRPELFFQLLGKAMPAESKVEAKAEVSGRMVVEWQT